MTQHLEAALPVGADPRRHARALAQVHEAALAGANLPSPPRAVIGASWQRMRRLGLDPDRGTPTDPLAVEALEARRRHSGLDDALPILRGGLTSVAEDAAHIMVVVDPDGVVLWRDGSSAVRRVLGAVNRSSIRRFSSNSLTPPRAGPPKRRRSPANRPRYSSDPYRPVANSAKLSDSPKATLAAAASRPPVRRKPALTSKRSLGR